MYWFRPWGLWLGRGVHGLSRLYVNTMFVLVQILGRRSVDITVLHHMTPRGGTHASSLPGLTQATEAKSGHPIASPARLHRLSGSQPS